MGSQRGRGEFRFSNVPAFLVNLPRDRARRKAAAFEIRALGPSKLTVKRAYDGAALVASTKKTKAASSITEMLSFRSTAAAIENSALRHVSGPDGS